jgi:tetratricopeptide (TPR) repeat protein
MRPWFHRFGVLLLATGLSGMALAHEGPEAEIEEITVEIARFGESAERLLQRAIEYRVLGRLKEAANDLQRAARLDSDRPGLRRELARVQEGQGQTNEALATVELGLGLKSIEPDERAALLALKAGLLADKGKQEPALGNWTEALRLQPENVDWHHSRSQLLREMGRHDERLKRLGEAVAATGSGMLEVERIDALLDAGRWTEALPRIESELASSRLRGSWLLRRGRALLGMSRADEARKDLEAAAAEIRARLGPGIREASLLAEVGLAEELLGHPEEAKRWYADALAAGAGKLVRERLEKLKAARRD